MYSKRKFMSCDQVQSFYEQTKALWLMQEAGHMGPQMYHHHEGTKNSQPVSGILTWDEYAKHGTLPKMNEEIFLSSVEELVRYVDKELPVIEFGPGSMNDAKCLIQILGSNRYIPVDCNNSVVNLAKNFAKAHNNCLVTPITQDFFSEENSFTMLRPAIGVLLGMTIGNVAGSVPKFEPSVKLVRTFKNLTKCLYAGGYLLVSTDICNDGEQNIYRYSDSWHKIFGVNHLYRMAEELPMTGFDPDGFEYLPQWFDHCSLLAHCVVANKNQSFQMGTNNQTHFDVHKGDVFHYNNSYKYRPEFFENCAKEAGLEVINTWQGRGTIRLYLFRVTPAHKNKDVSDYAKSFYAEKHNQFSENRTAKQRLLLTA